MSDHRDEAIERILRRGAAAPPAAAVGCLDAELLAAWTEHTLPTSEAERVEQHLSDCARCQAMVAVLARSTPPPAAVEPWWRRLQVRWLVPIATAVVLATVWVALPERSPETSSQIAVSHDVRGAGDAPRPQAEAPRVSPPPDRPSATLPVPSAPPVREETDARSPAEKSQVAGAPAKTTRAEMPAREARQLAPDTRPSEQLARQRAEAVAELRAALPPAPPAPSPQAIAAGPPPPPTPSPQAAAAAPPPPPAAAPAAGAERPAVPSAAESVMVTGATPLARAPAATANIVARSGGVQWRIVGGSQVQRSSTSGEWRTIDFRPDATLNAGHAPSANVLWLVGQDGTIYLSIDGARFTRVSFVDTSDLVSVSALSAEQATVGTSDGRSFRTIDGGKTWAAQ